MIMETLWMRIKVILNRPLNMSATQKIKAPSPMKKADDMLSTAIFDLTEALKESRKRDEH